MSQQSWIIKKIVKKSIVSNVVNKINIDHKHKWEHYYEMDRRLCYKLFNMITHVTSLMVMVSLLCRITIKIIQFKESKTQTGPKEKYKISNWMREVEGTDHIGWWSNKAKQRPYRYNKALCDIIIIKLV